MDVGISREQGNITKEHFKVVVGSAAGVVKVSGAPALTKCLTLTFFRGTFFVLSSTKRSTTTKCRLAQRYVFKVRRHESR